MTKEEVDAFWDRAKRQLKQANLNLKAYSAVTGVSVHTIYNQIQVGVLPDVESFLILARIADVNPYWLLWGDSPRAEINDILAAHATEQDKLGRLDMAELAKKANEMQSLINKLKENQ